MARTSKSTASKATQSDLKDEQNRSNVKADGTLAFGIVAGALGLSIALLENEKAAASENSVLAEVGANEATANHAVGAQSASQATGHDSGQSTEAQVAVAASVETGDLAANSPSMAAIPLNQPPLPAQEPVATEHSQASDGVEEGSPDATAEAGQVADQTEVASLAASAGETGGLADNVDLGATLTDVLGAPTIPTPATDILDPALDTLQPATGIVEPLLDALTPVAAIQGSALDTLEPVTNVIDPVVNIVGPVLGVLEPVGAVLEPVVGALEPVTNIVSPIVGPVLEPVVGALEPVTSIVSPVVGAMLEPVVGALEPVTNILNPVVVALEPAANVVTPVIGVLAPVANIIISEPVVNGLTTASLETAGSVVEPISGASESLLDGNLSGALGLTQGLISMAVPTLGLHRSADL